MVTSGNQNQVRLHGHAALGTGYDGLSPEARSALLWKQVDEMEADHGQKFRAATFSCATRTSARKQAETLHYSRQPWGSKFLPVSKDNPSFAPAAGQTSIPQCSATLTRGLAAP
jgi:hypothetical protein